MALTDKQKKKIEEEELYRQQVAKSINFPKQKHGMPALLSFLVCPGFIIHLWQVADAYNE